MISKSIKLKLFIWFLLAFSVLSIGSNVYVYYQQKKASLAAVDRHLVSQAQVFAGLIEVYDDGRVDFEPTELKAGFERARTIYDIPRSGHYFHIYFADGDTLTSSPSLGKFVLPVSFDRVSDGDYFDIVPGPDNGLLRIFSQKVTINIRDEKYSFIIQVAEELSGVYRFLDSLRMQIYFSVPVTLLATGLGGLLIIWLSLRPLERFSREVGNITERNLDKRMDEKKIDIELKDLAASFNTTLDNLERAFIQQKRFLSDVSHELRTPTAVIKSSCEIHLKKDRDKGEYKKALEIIMNSANRMDNLIERLLTLSRLEQKMYVFKKEKFSLCDVIRRSAHLLQPLADEKGITIELSSLPEGLNVQGDKDSVTEVFINIIENAIKYNREGGSITISSGEHSGDLKTDIKDTGIGIPESEIDNIFQSFYRVDRSRANGKTRGVGLGLNIVKAIVDKHGGKIEVTSRQGEGSTFSVYFPKSAL
ncbi:MAG: HAMP domain-containing protein [Nitrospirae bacterium]|nr:HAMP domain-containing protein [Nitrospirota bacterium]